VFRPGAYLQPAHGVQPFPFPILKFEPEKVEALEKASALNQADGIVRMVVRLPRGARADILLSIERHRQAQRFRGKAEHGFVGLCGGLCVGQRRRERPQPGEGGALHVEGRTVAARLHHQQARSLRRPAPVAVGPPKEGVPLRGGQRGEYNSGGEEQTHRRNRDSFHF